MALKQIVERVPEIVTALQSKLPDQLEDLESGYRKLLESGYHFTETDIESRFQQLHASLKNNMANVDVYKRQICGGSAIAAAAPIIEADEEEIALSMSCLLYTSPR